ncbi:hypothetical protein M2272_005757 [Mycobacterium frederiksbergense]|uniref:Uncharacterized protein n=1 Tax=Mycolicibacterium frederiksbergense TaxID=117567 RepID=A0ABT6L9P5_9MYCO|nr:hypothetical protein [Mycolicibacterium frederiksbergense]
MATLRPLVLFGGKRVTLAIGARLGRGAAATPDVGAQTVAYGRGCDSMIELSF